LNNRLAAHLKKRHEKNRYKRKIPNPYAD
jgi:hypothetical protein